MSRELSLGFEAIGTSWNISIPGVPEHLPLKLLEEKVITLIAEFDKVYSRFRADSLVAKASKAVGEYIFPEHAANLFAIYKQAYDLTGGLFTPMIGRTLEQAGYDAQYSLQVKTLASPPGWHESIAYMHPVLLVKKPVLLDFGAAGKGYLVDMVGALLADLGISTFIIDAGSDMLVRGQDQQQVGLEDPENPDQVIGVAKVQNQSLCASAGNRRAWGDFHHIINPRSLVSPKHILATWVVAETAVVADLIATCLFLIAPANLEQVFQFEYLILNSDRSVNYSLGFPAELFTR